MKMTFKKKIVAGTISVGLLSGVGLAFANTDAGGALKSWYSGVFNGAQASVAQEADQYSAEEFGSLDEMFEGLRAGAEFDVDFTKDREIGKASAAIQSARDSHISSLGEAENEILAGMDLAFNNVYQEGWLQIQAAGNEATQIASDDMTAFAGDTGAAAIEELTTQLDAVKAEALTGLEEAIVAAKAAIMAEVESEKTITVANLKTAVDFKVNEVFNQVADILDGLVAEQEALIEAKALELENEAKAAMDALLSDIND
ncbi:hypothetical protein QTL97_04030 [Sporosarcina thermotolerans]|uniref:Uncharacterized protein n=1 Tax=Sporosarcina thermotolerans TaxID=633404 RepID=A0AAW9A546_9BACL|nr:hypothetical protein [Sporosarcina thermotolerans]MDW0116092.1 hypothetical protein [Sporosarcina thermotolerans]WHT48062.1 hypothetical protein QNH10_18805 [Sporosarcina thermotolerans]